MAILPPVAPSLPASRTRMPTMRSLCSAIVFIALAFVSSVHGQTISTCSPRTIRPGETTKIQITGKGLQDSLRVITTGGSEWNVESVESETLVIEASLPAEMPLGPMGIWVVTTTSPSEMFLVMVDDLPVVAEAKDNHSIGNAQKIDPLVAIHGRSDGSQSDHYRFHAEKGQRVAVEVLTQDLRSAMDPVIALLRSDGTPIRLMDDDEVGPECRFSQTFESAGDYILQIQDNQYNAGGEYYLRVGDFPLVRHAFPLAVQRDLLTKMRFATIDRSVAERTEVVLPSQSSESISHVAARLSGGRSSCWTRVLVTDLPQIIEGDQNEVLPLPAGINGQLSTVGERDTFTIQGVKGQTFRFSGRTRSLASCALLKFQLLKADGEIVGQTSVNDSDEWSFDYKFPDDGQYQLKAMDLLGRGGQCFGYQISVSKPQAFQLALKPDAKSREQFSIESGTGACAVELQVSRKGYEGVVELSVDDPRIEILNPQIPAKAKAVKIYLAAGSKWNADSSSVVRITGQAKDDPNLTASVDNISLQRTKRPHIPFPLPNDHRVLTLGGTKSGEAYFSLEPNAPVQFARQTRSHQTALSLKRGDKEFKSPVTILSNRLPPGWRVSAKADKDQYNLTWNRGDIDSQPGSLPLLVYSEFKGRGRLTTAKVPIQWIDPIAMQIQHTGPLIGGKTNSIRAHVHRAGNDHQVATLKFTELPEGWSAPKSVAIAADAKEISFELHLPENIAPTAGSTIRYELAGKYHGADYVVSGTWSPPKVVPLPTELQVHPAELSLDGENQRQQLIVTGIDASGAPRDWTRGATFLCSDNNVAQIANGVVTARSDGSAQITVQLGPRKTVVPVRVSGSQSTRPVRFESEVLVALSKQGCNSGACHGSPSGKGMFRLSLRAFDKQLDELTLIREDFGRRVNRLEPEKSLLLLKPLMKVNHGGGKQLHPDDPAYAVIRDWIAEGAVSDSPDAPRCNRLEVFPSEKRTLPLDASQQLSVMAHFTDGTSRDVTHLVAYESSNMDVAKVDRHGLITPVSRGESMVLVRFLEHIEAVPIAFVDHDPAFEFEAPQPNNYIDELVHAKLRQLQYQPSKTCTDDEFLRRVYLDVIGILPTAQESKAFLDDTRAEKRSEVIDRLLQRDEFAKFWALKWGDLLRMTGKSVGDEGVHKYHRWVEQAFRDNMPYDQFSRSLLAARGSTLANPPANFYRTAADMNDCVETVSQIFLGARLQCAKCHNHPFERWTQDNYYGLGAFFNRLQRRKTQRPGETFVYASTSGEVTQPRTGQTMKPWLPVEGEIEVSEATDRRDVFVDWLVKADNPYFSRIEANRIWSHCFSRGIVEPIDDFRASNPPSNEPLLDALAKDFADHGFDRVHLLGTILNSKTYQASYQTTDSNRDDREYFSHQRPRLLSAEQLLDAINQTMGLEQTFGKLPPGTKATHLPAPDLVKVEFLKVFGQPERSTVCACERVDDSNLGMAIELFNGETIHQKLRDKNNRFRKAVAAGVSAGNAIDEMYLAALCRYPTQLETDAALEHCKKRDNVADALEDICWALINTDEFLFQH